MLSSQMSQWLLLVPRLVESWAGMHVASEEQSDGNSPKSSLAASSLRGVRWVNRSSRTRDPSDPGVPADGHVMDTFLDLVLPQGYCVPNEDCKQDKAVKLRTITNRWTSGKGRAQPSTVLLGLVACSVRTERCSPVRQFLPFPVASHQPPSTATLAIDWA
ncbi:hypothetical protein CB1_000224013 [Camelus ferus]|nr:hypothetical protein CB1_000224013 [Camelus ferus]